VYALCQLNFCSVLFRNVKHVHDGEWLDMSVFGVYYYVCPLTLSAIVILLYVHMNLNPYKATCKLAELSIAY